MEEVDVELAESEEQLRTLDAYVRKLRKKVDEEQAAAEKFKDLDSLKEKLDAKQDEVEKLRQTEVGVSLCSLLPL